VTPSSTEEPVYFSQKWSVPAIAEGATGVASLEGSFSLGEGEYQVDWLLRDRAERVCSAYWRVSARMPLKGGEMSAGVPPGVVAESGADLYASQEAARAEDDQQRLSLTILLNIGSPVEGAAGMSSSDSAALVSTLRSILRDPRINNVCLTAFDLKHRQVIFQQDNIRLVNLASLEKAIASVRYGTIDVNQLGVDHGEGRFLVRLAAERAKQKRPDALIFIGQKMLNEDGMTRELLAQLGEARCPVFYLTYASSPGQNPWRDLIGSAVKYWRGREFSISRPLDLLSAWSKIVTQLKNGSSVRGAWR
jgi:hypothetical protein